MSKHLNHNTLIKGIFERVVEKTDLAKKFFVRAGLVGCSKTRAGDAFILLTSEVGGDVALEKTLTGSSH